MTLPVSNNRPIAYPAKVLTAPPKGLPVPSPTIPKPPKDIEAQPQGKIQDYNKVGGAIGGGLAGAAGGVGLTLLVAFIGASSGNPMTWPIGLACLAIPTLAGAVLGGAWGNWWGGIKERAVEKVTNDPSSQIDLYIAGGSASSAAWSMYKVVRGAVAGRLTNFGIAGLADVATGGYLTVKEIRTMKKEGGNQLTDNKVRIGGAMVAMIGGGIAAIALIPAAAAAVPFLLPVGVGLALVGWSTNVVGQFMNEKRHDIPAAKK